ncbi:exosortase B [Massilia sp. DWR3-1-1]|uniref:exosortase B n=1 Tax=Massilia sp. DWR3-1-1 TaxID=2804559 RepID=UPI003CFB2457
MRFALLPVAGVRAGMRHAARPEWLLLWGGLAALYVPTLYRLLTEVWNKPAQAHGPIILVLALWLMWRKWQLLRAACGGDRPSGYGWMLLAPALLLYVVGRSQQILLFEIGSVPVLLAAVLLLKHGPRALRLQCFPLFFMLFMVPLPEAVVSALTMPMKLAVSLVTEKMLYAAGYPVGRQGVILQAGQYQLLVADACAGLQTVFTLEAMGLLYLNLVRHAAKLRNTVLALLIVPVSFAANVIRVTVLVLVTYYLGEAAGQGFIHQFAGMVLFVSALLLILSVDGALGALLPFHAGGKRARAVPAGAGQHE